MERNRSVITTRSDRRAGQRGRDPTRHRPPVDATACSHGGSPIGGLSTISKGPSTIVTGPPRAAQCRTTQSRGDPRIRTGRTGWQCRRTGHARFVGGGGHSEGTHCRSGPQEDTMSTVLPARSHLPGERRP
jgi:hypothetical protein